MKKTTVAAALSVSLLVSGIAHAASFRDVPANHWARGVIDWGVDQHIVVGYPDGTFRPAQHVTEAEFLTMLIRAYNPKLPQVKVKKHWADEIYAFSQRMNYPLEGYDDLKKRSWIIDRTRVAEIIAGAYGYNFSGRDAIHFLLARGIAKGKDPREISIDAYKGNDPLTRAEAVAFVQRVLESGLKELQPRPKEPSDPNLLPPLPTTPPEQQPPAQQPPAQQPPAQPPAQQQPSQPGAWQPGDSRLLADAFFKTIKDNGDGTVTVTIPAVPGYEVGADYMPPRGSGLKFTNLQPGKTYTLKKGSEASITVAMRKPPNPSNIEGYTVFLDGSWKVGLDKRVGGKYVHEVTTLDAIKKGLGLQ